MKLHLEVQLKKKKSKLSWSVRSRGDINLYCVVLGFSREAVNRMGVMCIENA